MASSPMNSRPPGAAPPQHSAGKILLVVGLVLAMIIAAAGLAIYIGIRILAHNVSVTEVKGASGSKQYTIRTPAGHVEIQQGTAADLGLLGLPVYPGARRVMDNGNATVSASFAGRNLVGVLAAKFETHDPMERVRDFYQSRLSGRITRFIRKDSHGKTVFEIKTPGQEKIVSLNEGDGVTRIELVKVVQGRDEAN